MHLNVWKSTRKVLMLIRNIDVDKSLYSLSVVIENQQTYQRQHYRGRVTFNVKCFYSLSAVIDGHQAYDNYHNSDGEVHNA